MTLWSLFLGFNEKRELLAEELNQLNDLDEQAVNNRVIEVL